MKDVRGVAGWGATLSESVGRKGRGLTETVKINIFAMVKSSTSKKVFPVGLKIVLVSIITNLILFSPDNKITKPSDYC